MTNMDMERLVRVEVIMDEIRSDLRELLKKVEIFDTRLRATEDDMRAAKVGWKVLLTVGSAAMTAAGAIGALIAKWLPFLGGLPK